ncbi:MAG TPA: 2Fe-2S iron-sulfur cluster binding domain-containing protein [Anaerolineae bacterium]|nr:2Fe-2S iron-sulfur cluster binding domain-containing protein [Anaerolineae bacterium]
MWERYFTPDSVEVALNLLAEHGDHARIVAGATDLILELERGLRPEVKILVDITRIPGLDRIEIDEKGWIHVGPLVTHNHVAGSSMIIDRAFALAQACWQIGAPQIRNRGTVAGNLITASPANDSIPPLMAFGAQVTLRSVHRERVVPLDEFYTGVRQTVMGEDELLTDIAFPALPVESRSAFIKLGLRRAQAISVVNVAVMVEMDEEVVKDARITMGSVAPKVIRAPEAEQFLVGKILKSEVFVEVGDRAAAAAKPIDDLRSSAEYRTEMVRVCTIRALRALAGNRERESYPAHPVMLWGAEGMQARTVLSTSYEHYDGKPIETSINGRPYVFEDGWKKTLLRLLREEASLIGTKEGCAEGECGACTVFLDGVAVMSCLVPAPRAHKAEIVTIEGLAHDDQLHPIQQAFIDEGAVQCGYCTPGFLMSGAKLLEERPHPSREEIEQAITGNLCRCTGYYKILSAIESAASLQEKHV